jgi:dihydroorotase
MEWLSAWQSFISFREERSSLSNPINPPSGWHELSANTIRISNARLFDPAAGLDRTADIVIADGKIVAIGENAADYSGVTIDGSGLTVTPGLFDMHVHLREPGFEHKETVQTGCVAAAAGGFTGVACMPNTKPALDNPGLVEFVRTQAIGTPVEVHPIAATTKGRKGEILSEMSELVEAGVRGFSDDGAPVASADLMRRALEYSHMLGAVIIEHSEEPSLTNGGLMHEGAVSTRLGLIGWPGVGEEIAIQRNIMLAEYTGGRLHCAHVSTARGVELIREAKKRGLQVTGEVAPHHLTLDCSIIEGYDSDYKVNPPLRENSDIEALIVGLAEGTIDAIATDHAPHAADEKEVEFALAPFGMVGLETAFGVVHTELVRTGRLSLSRAIDALTAQPRNILRLPEVRIEIGAEANLALFDLEESWTVDRDLLNSRSHNTPFHGWKLTGRPVGVVKGEIAWMKKR